MQLAARAPALSRPGSVCHAVDGVPRLSQRRLVACRRQQQLRAATCVSASLPSSLPTSSTSSSSSPPASPPLPCLQRRPLHQQGQQQQQQRQRQVQQQQRRPAPPAQARARDPDALDVDDEEQGNKGPPTLFWRVLSAMCYLVPWIDSMSLGREMYARFRNLLVLYFIPGQLAKIYFSSQFAPLIIFFVMFLSVVKNTKLHHFVRFSCMQAIMLDIVVMLFHILRAYLPSELKWSAVGKAFDMFGWTACMGTVVYCVFWTLRGYYADLPFVSESVYIQVAQSEYQ